MWQYQKLSMLLALGLVAISTSTGCATNVEEPVGEEAMATENAAESSEALTTGSDWRGGGFGKFGPGRGYGWGRNFGRGGFYGGYGYGYGYDDYGCGDSYGWGDFGYDDCGYGGYGDYYPGNINIVVEQNNGYGPGYGDLGPGYGDYGPGYDDYVGYDDCGDDYYDDDWN